MSQQQNHESLTQSQYATPIAMIIIGMLLSGGAFAFAEIPVLQLIVGLISLGLILGAAILAVRRMQRDPDLNS